MIIKSLEIENIRSYKKEKINFKNGINFLSGDIGSGKSSILQAIEFGFLGFKKGDLEGIHLLRKGENKAFVKIILENNENEIEIFRKIKKSKSGHISQENGYIKFENNIIELSPKELDFRIFEILNFPKEFLSKNKNLVYRFTIYTPQEQLKEIIFSKSDEKLEIIRKIFGIDKYKQLKNAINIYMSEIRENKSFFKAKLENKEENPQKIKNIEKELKNQKNEILENSNKYKEVIFKKEDLFNLENKYSKYFDIINEKKILNEKNLTKIEEMEKQKDKLNIEFESSKRLKNEFETQNIETEIEICKNEIENIENKKIQILNEEKEIQIKEIQIKEIQNENLHYDFEIKNNLKFIKNIEFEVENISKLKECSKCKQIVKSEHKNNLKKENEKIKKEKITENNQLEKKIEINNEKINKILNNNTSFEKRINEINQIKNEFNNKILNNKLKIEKQLNLILKKKEINSKIIEIKNKIDKINEIILKKESLKNNKKILIEKEDKHRIKFFEIKEKLKKINSIEISISNNLSIIKTNLKRNEKDLIKFEKEKIEIEKFEKQLKKVQKMENFLSNQIIKIADLIERTIFTKFYLEFNEEFEKYFKQLIEDNEIEVRLSNEFSPIIEQNGYDIDISNLSGGEKSSLAISYRFGLKKIIETNMISTQSLSLLILDEPTDGFSTNQVDRLGEILKEFDLKQIILVSHDSRIESICDNIINIEKINHNSFLN